MNVESSRKTRVHRMIVLSLALLIVVLGGCHAGTREYVRGEEYVRSADTQFRAGRYDEAIASAKQAVAMNPRYAPGWFWLGASYGKKEQWDQAIPALKKVIELAQKGPEIEWSHYWLGSIYNQTGDYGQAVAHLKRAVDLAPRDWLNHHQLGISYTKSGQYDQAIQALKRAMELNPADKGGLTHRVLGWAYLGRRQYDQAILVLRRALELDPADKGGGTHYLLGKAYLENGQSEQAISALRRSIELGRAGTRYVGVGLNIHELEGVLTVQAVLEGSPASHAWLRAGDQIVRIDGSPTQGLPVAEAVKRIGGPHGTRVTLSIQRPGFAEPRDFSLTRSLIEGRSDAQQALQDANERLAKVSALVEQARRAEQAGRLREALEQCREALKLTWQGPRADQLREQVIALVQKLPAPPPISEEVERRLARARIIMQEAKAPAEFEPAVGEFQQALRLAPWWPGIYFNLGLLHEKLGQYKEALRNLRLYLKADPRSAQAGAVRQKIYELEFRQERVGAREGGR